MREVRADGFSYVIPAAPLQADAPSLLSVLPFQQCGFAAIAGAALSDFSGSVRL